MAGMAYLKLFYDNWVMFEPLTMEERGKLITFIFSFVRDGLEPDSNVLGNLRFIWGTVRNQLERDKQAYEHKAETARNNGIHGGRPTNSKTKLVMDSQSKTDWVSKNVDKLQEEDKDQYNDYEKEDEKDHDHYYNNEPLNDTPVKAVVDYARNNLKSISDNILAELKTYCEKLPSAVVNHAIDEACSAGATNYAYVRKVLQRYLEEGVQSLDAATISDKRFKSTFQHSKQQPQKEPSRFAGINRLI